MNKVLVTGADGFIGSHLTQALLDEGCEVRALAQYNSFNNWGWLEDIRHPGLEVVTGDVRDPNYCRHIALELITDQHFLWKWCIKVLTTFLARHKLHCLFYGV